MQFTRTDRARALRQSAGFAEDRVWARLRGGKLDGHKFRRQHPIGPYYADFACDRLRLIIEIDGAVHLLDDVIARDRTRQAALEASGWTVLRFTNDQVLNNPEQLSEAVRRHVQALGL
ncbi:MAG: endonuclease domain-containing protein [Rhodoferax sp.]|uniref:endonuclease domain-containing protein n=1 Tax=Rhodoferax sp. TaxID=50421 RepID=UPI002730A757|nr:endonuclease domain-containing protein [Rhodoferax sp.]MDP1528589.1 endonuclease domain-containing protein [Rhodoferax sp.]